MQGCISGISSFSHLVFPLAFSPQIGNENFDFKLFLRLKVNYTNKNPLSFPALFVRKGMVSILCALDLLW